jgi:hypothetical protein
VARFRRAVADVHLDARDRVAAVPATALRTGEERRDVPLNLAADRATVSSEALQVAVQPVAGDVAALQVLTKKALQTAVLSMIVGLDRTPGGRRFESG